MKKVFLVLMAAIGAGGSGLYATDSTKPATAEPVGAPAPPAQAAVTPPAGRGDDENAIKALLERFVKAFNAGNADATAATYSEKALVVDERGERVEGRAAVRDQYAASFAQGPGSKITIKVDSLRFLGPETALEEGRTTITPAAASGAPEITRFTAIYVKQDGQWLQAAVRDELAHDLTPHDRLKELEWLVGDWINESQDAIVSTSCAWAKGGNFLDREFTMKTEGLPVLSGTQRIGWDPVKRQFKTWIFDSAGGHGEGHFTHNGDQWMVKVEGVGREGQPVSATNIITRMGNDRMNWRSVDRTFGSTAAPGADEFTVVRKPPDAGK
jgi:uncharacterized protein (TIGR02246 family)